MTKSLKVTINVPAYHVPNNARFCWELFGRYLTEDTEAEVTINVQQRPRFFWKFWRAWG